MRLCNTFFLLPKESAIQNLNKVRLPSRVRYPHFGVIICFLLPFTFLAVFKAGLNSTDSFFLSINGLGPRGKRRKLVPRESLSELSLNENEHSSLIIRKGEEMVKARMCSHTRANSIISAMDKKLYFDRGGESLVKTLSKTNYNLIIFHENNATTRKELLDLGKIKNDFKGCGSLTFVDLAVSSWFVPFARSNNTIFKDYGRSNVVFTKVAAMWYASRRIHVLAPYSISVIWCDHDVYVHKEFNFSMLNFLESKELVYIYRRSLPEHVKKGGHYGKLCKGSLECFRSDTGIIYFGISNGRFTIVKKFLSCFLNSFIAFDSRFLPEDASCGFRRSPKDLALIHDLDDTYQFDFAIKHFKRLNFIKLGYFALCSEWIQSLKRKKDLLGAELWQAQRYFYRGDNYHQYACVGDPQTSPKEIHEFFAHEKGNIGTKRMIVSLKNKLG